jgi:hypothetical protein
MMRSNPSPATLDTGDRAACVASEATIWVRDGSIVDSAGLDTELVVAARTTFAPTMARPANVEIMMMMV